MPGQVMSLAEVLRKIDERAEEALEPLRRREVVPAPKGYKWYYCPKCLTSHTLSRYVVKKGRVACSRCNEPMRPLDEEFFKRSEELVETWRDKAKALIEKVWDVLEKWWPYKPMTADVGADVTIYFDHPSYFKVEIERAKGEGAKLKAELYAHYFDERNVPMLQKVIEAVKEAKLEMHIAIDGRPDHCTVPKEKMEEMGFKRHSIWSLWVMDVSP